MLQLDFHSIKEATPGPKWKHLFDTHWPAYKSWLQSKGALGNPDVTTSVAKLKQYMPEMTGTFDTLCELIGNDRDAVRFLTGYKPPAYITGCSQIVWKDEPQLVRNYDYHPDLCEGTLLNSKWNGKSVIATGDCLIGVVDGMNEDGLVASLTFGGRKVVGNGFGIPFILRYVLEFCSDVPQAIEALKSVPTHMAYNVMLLDKSGLYKMLELAPDHEPRITDMAISTNHQGAVDWPEHAAFSKTIERERYLKEFLETEGHTSEEAIELFLKTPLFNRKYKDGFGTIYTAVYKPEEGKMELRWPNKILSQSFGDFSEGVTALQYSEEPTIRPLETAAADYASRSTTLPTAKSFPQFETGAEYWKEYGKSWASGSVSDGETAAAQVIHAVTDALGIADDQEIVKFQKKWTEESVRRGQIPWELLADLWSKIG